MSPVTPPTEDDEKSLRIDTGSPPTPQKIADVPEECQPKPQAVVPPMHSETSPVSNDDNRGLVPGIVPRHPVTCQGLPVSLPDAPLPLQSVLTATLSSPQPPQPSISLASQLQPGQAVMTSLAAQTHLTSQPIPSLFQMPTAIPQAPVLDETTQAQLVLRNLAEIGKRIPDLAAILNPTLPPVIPPKIPSPVRAPLSPPHHSTTAPPVDMDHRTRSHKSNRDKSKSRRDKKSRSEQTSEKRKVFKKRKDFQRAVVNTAKESIKPFYKNRRIDKQEYKKIMRDLVKKIVNTSRTYTVDKDKIARMVEKYVSRYTTSAPPSDRKRKKEEMLGFFNEKDNGKRNSPDSGSDSNSISDIIESAGRSGALTIPQLPLPPPPPKQPPPRQFGKSRF